MRRCSKTVLVFASVAALSITSMFAQTVLLSDQDIREILVERIDVRRQGVGIVVGVIDHRGRRVISHGVAAKDSARPLDGDTVFEIGSITKAFTSLLLAKMVQQGEVTLADPVSKYLPATVTLPTRGGRQITLQDLASHMSGLPGMPANFKPTNPRNPYEGYTVERMHQFLASYELPRDIGSRYEYSNLGGALLGSALAHRAAKTYEALVYEQITGPLRMESTRIALTADMQARIAQGHNARLERTPNWDLSAFEAAGALRSTTNDMLTFLAVPLGYQESPLAKAFAAMYSPRHPTGMGPVEIALGWHVMKTSKGEIIWHNGGTGGYRSFAGFDLRARTGVIVLSNTLTSVGVDDIGLHILDPEISLAPAPKVRTEKQVDPKIFEQYTGSYQLAPNRVLNITSENNRLFAQVVGQNKFELFPESATGFFAKVVEIELVFEVDANGRATAVTLMQGNSKVKANRINP